MVTLSKKKKAKLSDDEKEGTNTEASYDEMIDEKKLQ